MNRRQKKKREKRDKLSSLLKNKIYIAFFSKDLPPSKLEKQSFKDLSFIISQVEKKSKTEEKKERKRIRERERYQQKKKLIEENNLKHVSAKDSIDKIKKEIQKTKRKKLQGEKIRYLVNEKGFDPYDPSIAKLSRKSWKDVKNAKKYSSIMLDKIYDFGGKGMYFGYKDYTGYHDIEAIYKLYVAGVKDDEHLMEQIKFMVNLRPTFSRKRKKKIIETEGETEGGTNGKAGDYRFYYGSEELCLYEAKIGYKLGFSTIEDGCIKKINLRTMLYIVGAIMENVTELKRGEFYYQWYTRMVKIDKKLIDFLPPPKLFR